MAHLLVFTYNDTLLPGGVIQFECSQCRALAGHIYTPGTEPLLPIHEHGCECYYLDIYTPGDPNLPMHTHQDLLNQLDAFGPWLDEMERELSHLAATLLDLTTRVCVDAGA